MINAGPIETVGDLITVLQHFNRETPVRFDSGAEHEYGPHFAPVKANYRPVHNCDADTSGKLKAGEWVVLL